MLKSLGHGIVKIYLNESYRVLVTMMEPKYGFDLSTELWNWGIFLVCGLWPHFQKNLSEPNVT